MSRIVLALCLVFTCSTALAVVPVPLLGQGCDDDDPIPGGDGLPDVASDCWDDLLRCTHITVEATCNGAKACNWDATHDRCIGTEWAYASYVPQRWRTRMAEPIELSLGSGMHVDRAWQRHTGRWDTIVAVLDSGIRWRETDLQNKHYLNRGELPVPQNAKGADTAGRAAGENPACPEPDTYDHNKDCIFNIQDYAEDPRVLPDDSTPLTDAFFSRCHHPFNNGDALIATDAYNTILEPGDLICIFSDGIDNDGNGYTDDISGWDFLWDDNNPLDDTNFGHGTGEGRDSCGEADNGGGLPGICPNCALLSVRAGDSFVVDANNWAAGVVFAIDSGARVLQSAVGAINNTSFSQAAIEYAYDRGVANIISAADETAQHHNQPGAGNHAEYVHGIRYDSKNINLASTWLNFSNCTNFGGRLTLSASTTGCSSGATGASSGIAGLMMSAMQDTGAPPLTGNEIHQILIHSVDDIDLPTSQPDHPNHDAKRYPSKEGWDMYFGYGRINARKVVDAVLAGQIPPEADLVEPAWWSIVDPAGGALEIRGAARAPRATSGTWVLEYGVGPQPDDFDPVDTSVWRPIASGQTPAEGLLGTWDAREVPFDPAARIEPYNTRADRGPVDNNYTKALKVNRHTVTLRLRVMDDRGLEGEDRKTIYVHTDPTWKPGFPLSFGVSLTPPTMADLDSDGRFEIVFGDDNGWVHAMTAEATELDGWPVRTHSGRVITHPDARAFTRGADGTPDTGDELPADVASTILAALAIADLGGDGRPDVVAATLDGEVYAWDAGGTLRAGFPVDAAGSYQGHDANYDAFIEHGIFAAPVIEDIDGDGLYDIVIASLDQSITVLRDDGTVLDGFPVNGPRDPADLSKPFTRMSFEGNDDGQHRRIISTPAVGDLDGDGNIEILFGTNEAINEQLSVVHAITYDRSAGEPRAYASDCGTDTSRKRCFPIQMVGGYPNALPYVAEGAPMSPVLADLDSDGTLEIGAASIADFGRVYRHDGFDSFDSTSAFVQLKSYQGFYGLNTNSDQSSSLVMINSGAFADLDGDGVLDYLLGTAGSSFVDNLMRDGERADFDHQLSVWSMDDGAMLDGFPQIMEDLQFFLNPVVADVDGDGNAEVVNTSATYVVHAFRADGSVPAGWPKFTGQWQYGSPALGDVDGDGLLEMALSSREGWLFVYELEGRADGNVQWSSFHHDARNTGNFHTPDPTLAFPADIGGIPCDGCCCRDISAPLGALAGLLLPIVIRRRRL